MAGPEWERGVWLFRGEATLSLGTQRHKELETREQTVGLALSALTGIQLGGVFLRAGPLLGGEMIFQKTAGREARSAFAARVGPRLRLDIPLTRNLGIYMNGDLALLAVPADGEYAGLSLRVGGLGLFAWGGYGLGLLSAW